MNMNMGRVWLAVWTWKSGMQMNQVIFDTFLHKILWKDKCIQFVGHYNDVSIVGLYTWV
jgi:hypothetical protein